MPSSGDMLMSEPETYQQSHGGPWLLLPRKRVCTGRVALLMRGVPRVAREVVQASFVLSCLAMSGCTAYRVHALAATPLPSEHVALLPFRVDGVTVKTIHAAPFGGSAAALDDEVRDHLYAALTGENSAPGAASSLAVSIRIHRSWRPVDTSLSPFLDLLDLLSWLVSGATGQALPAHTTKALRDVMIVEIRDGVGNRVLPSREMQTQFQVDYWMGWLPVAWLLAPAGYHVGVGDAIFAWPEFKRRVTERSVTEVLSYLRSADVRDGVTAYHPGAKAAHRPGDDGEAGAMEQSVSQYWAVLIGVSRYANVGTGGLQNLRYAARDAERLCEQLGSGDPVRWPKENVRLLTDTSATREAVSDAILSFLKKAQKNDVVLIFFSCHGAPDPSRARNNYFLCHDTDPRKLTTTGFPMWEIDSALQRGIIEAQRVIVFADACHSGGFAPEGMKDLRIVSRNVSQGIQALGRGAHCRVVSSCQPGELSRQDADWGRGHGAFAYALIRGLAGAADSAQDGNSRGNGDGSIELDELVHYLRREVARLTNNAQHVQDKGRLNVVLAGD